MRTRIHLLKPGLQLLDFKVTSELNLKRLSDGVEIQGSTRDHSGKPAGVVQTGI